MNRTRLTLWVVAAVLAVGVTTAAVTVANASGGQDDVLSQEEVSRQLGQETGEPVAPEATGTPQTPGTPGGDDPAGPADGAGEVRTLRSQAGQVAAQCADGLAYLTAWSPNPGYRVDEVVRGPAAVASVWIESDSFDDVEILVSCEGGEPVLTEMVEPDDHDDDDDDDHGDDHDDDDRSGRDHDDDDDRDGDDDD
jgi:hypothetical protein